MGQYDGLHYSIRILRQAQDERRKNINCLYSLFFDKAFSVRPEFVEGYE